MKNKYKIKNYKINVVYNNKYLFKFVFSKTNVKIEKWGK
jgi:hypothetical protein